MEAEVYAILSTIFWLVEQKHEGQVKIYSDCLFLVMDKSLETIRK
jgi:hypothetical protein